MSGERDAIGRSGVTAYRLHVDDAALADLDRRLAGTRFLDDMPAGDVFGGDARYGASVPFTRGLVEHWRGAFDWRALERRINRQPQVLCDIDGVQVHAIHRRSARADAMPLVLLHGWPSSILEFVDICDALADPPAHCPAFHVVVPSLPGYGLSTTRLGLGPQPMAALLRQLMERLGYERYIVQGGNWGSVVGTEMARQAPDAVAGLHLNSTNGSAPPGHAAVDEREASWLARQQPPASYPHFVLYSRSPASMAHALNDSPAGLAAWLGLWLRGWADTAWPDNPGLSADWLVGTAAFYWLTGCVATSAMLYWEMVANPPAERFVDVPTAVFLPEHEMVRIPRSWAEHHYRIVRWTLWPRGGHFPAIEIADAFVGDLCAFAAELLRDGVLR